MRYPLLVWLHICCIAKTDPVWDQCLQHRSRSDENIKSTLSKHYLSSLFIVWLANSPSESLLSPVIGFKALPSSDLGVLKLAISCQMSSTGSYRIKAWDALPSGYSPPAMYIRFWPLTTRPCLLEGYRERSKRCHYSYVVAHFRRCN